LTEAAAALSAGGRLLVVDFAPHELEHLRESQAHRRLGFSHAQMKQWIAGAGLKLETAEDLAPGAASGSLTVTIWTALDRRAAEGGRKAGARA
jgi:ArsR family transcriptional regulator